MDEFFTDKILQSSREISYSPDSIIWEVYFTLKLFKMGKFGFWPKYMIFLNA